MKSSAFHRVLLAISVALVVALLFGCSQPAAQPAAAPKAEEKKSEAPKAEAPKTEAAKPAAEQKPSGAMAIKDPDVPKPKKKYKIGAAMVSSGEPFQESVKWAIREEAKKYDVDVVILDAGGYGNIAKQTAQIEDLIQQKVDAIMLWAVSFEGTAPAVDNAVAKGIPVTTFITPSKSEKVSTFVAVDDTVIGQTLAEYQGKAMGGKGNVVMISGGEGAAWSKMRSDGYRKAMKEKYPDIKILDEKWTTALDPATSMKIMEDLLQTYPNVDGAYTTITGMAFGASKAVDAAGKKGKITLVGSSIQGKDEINLLKQGTVSVVTGEPAILSGRWALDYTLKVLAGESVPKYVPVPTPVYTKENVGTADFSLELSPEYLK